MTSLAESLLADLDELDEEDEVPSSAGQNAEPGAGSDAKDGLSKVKSEFATHASRDEAIAKGDVSIKEIATLRESPRYKQHLASIRRVMARGDGAAGLDDELSELVVVSNTVLVEMQEELGKVHTFVEGLYAQKFAALTDIVKEPLDYIRVVQRIGNEDDMTVIDLSDILSKSQVMVVTVTGSTADAKLRPAVLARVMEACEEGLALAREREEILGFVEARMIAVAPNVTALTGSRVAALLVGLAGGLAELARMPAGNIQVLGQERQALLGFSTAATSRHMGALQHCDLVRNAPEPLRRKTLRTVAAKLTLVARMDAHGGAAAAGGAQGEAFREEIERKVEKWMEPPKGKTRRALPRPDEAKKTRRGGRRERRKKELQQQTHMAKQLNRIAFAREGGDDYGAEAMGEDLGMLGKSGMGAMMRMAQKDTRVGRKRQKIQAGTSHTTGSLTSLAFTPAQGICLENPEDTAKRARKAAQEKYFGTKSGFVTVINARK